MSQPSPDSLAAVIARTEGAIAASAPGEVWPWRFARCWMLATLVDDHDGTAADMDAAIAEFHLLPIDVPSRAKLAAVLAAGQLRRGMLRDYERLRQGVALADIANTDPAPLPAWPKADAALRSLYVMHRVMRGSGQPSVQEGFDEVERHAELVGDEEPYVTMVELARVQVMFLRAQERRDFATMEEAVAGVERIRQRRGNDRHLGALPAVLAENMRIMLSIQRGDLPAAQAGVQRLVALVDGLPSGSAQRLSAENMVAGLRAGLGTMRAGIGYGAQAGARFETWGLRSAPDADVSADVREFYERVTGRPASPAELSSHQSMFGLVQLLEGDTEVVDRAVDWLRTSVATAPLQDPHRQEYLMALGLALAIRYEDRREPADLIEAIRVMSRSRSLAGSPAHPHWADCSKTLGHAYRLAGRTEDGCAIGLDGLRGHAYSVLLQADTVGRTNASRDAAEDAIDVARWFMTEGDGAGAAAALDAGRSLILFAATEHRAVAERLVERGQARLAERWRAAAHGTDATRVPIVLRQEVLAGLTGRLESPGPDQVQAALRTLDLDALVYLVPGDDGSGAAVIVPSQGAARPVLLPLLHRSHMPDLGRTELGGGSRRDARARTWVSLDDVCEWAWRAVVAPVLKKVPGTRGRLPRIALVPMRELAVVPWHAARTTEDGRTVRAVERVVFSYALSARLLCDSAAASRVPLNDRGLFVGDPDTGGRESDLPAARAEAWAIRERYYPAATYVGRAGDGSESPGGPGRAKDIVDWLTDSAGGSVLHLACHGVVNPTPAIDNPDPGLATDTAYLVLSAGERLAAERIVATRPVGLVVLAACNSGVAVRGGYDEAFSLAATFLAAGSRTVVSSQWSVPDGATSVLMFMFHHHLRAGLAPLDALHRAQLWMIAEGRQPPAEMPERLRSHLTRVDPSDVDAWAGFIHIGQ
jgi:hypothetical protein